MEPFSTHLSKAQDIETLNVVQLSDALPPVNSPTVDHLSSFHLTTPSHSFFQNARNFEVKDVQFNTSANVTINHNSTANDPVSTILWPHVVAGAIFNSAERYGAGKCHAGTRKKIIERIVAWIEDPDPAKQVLWIYGPAGAGKSAIAQTICELLKESYPDNDGGSFFFSNGPSDRGNAIKLFATLAYQLAIQFPSIRTELNDVLSRDPSLPTKSMEFQLLSLIIHPLLRCKPPLSRTPVLIIDGLDECDNGKGSTQSDIVALISKSVVDYNIPLRFMILSRPEYWIRDAFDTPPLPDITLPLSLQDDIDADDDIRAYLTEGFERIRLENKRFMTSVALPWPPTEIVDRFVEEASGQYIYAATVLRFVGNISKFSSPQKQLDILILPGPYRALAFSELDRLYATILAAYPQWETMKRVLAALLLGANTTIITVILGVDSDGLALVLDALSSLIDIKKRRSFSDDWNFLESVFQSESLQDGLSTISFCHRSFREFLRDESRSEAFYIDIHSNAAPLDIMNRFFGMVNWNLDHNYEIEPYVYCDIDYATYHHQMFQTFYCSIFSCTIGFLLPHFTHLTVKFELLDPGKFTRMHSIFYFIHEMTYFQALDLEIFEPRGTIEDPELLTEFGTTFRTLQLAITLACEGAMSALASCTDFKATPALVYLTEYWSFRSFRPSSLLDGLRTIAGITDVVPTLNQYRFFFSMCYNTAEESWTPSGAPLKWNSTTPDWRTQGAWRDIRTSFASRSLKLMFKQLGTGVGRAEYDAGYGMLTKFFDSRKISDIANNEYFHDTCKLAILSTMTDTEAWISLLNNDQGLPPPYFLCSILRWINRQLTNPQTVTLLQNYNKTLQHAMATAMNYVFEHGFLKVYTKSSTEELCVYTLGLGTEYDPRSIAIKVWPLPKGFYEEEMHEGTLAYMYWNSRAWEPLHNELFGETAESMKSPIDPIIPPSKWHPHLGHKLLRLLVRFIYGLVHPDFSTEHDDYEESFPYLLQCLPCIHPTPENLDALRALVYLYPQVVPPWNPPEGLWSLLVDFLNKYDRSILSAEELRLFVAWLNSTKHEDIRAYIDD